MALELVTDEDHERRELYCAGEGANQFGSRISAWLEPNYGEGTTLADLDAPDALDILPGVPNLFTGGDLYEKVLAKARRRKYDLVIIDTYARATAGSDLNSQGDQAVVTSRVDELKRATEGTVLLVAHSQKSDLDASGSIEIEDARDFVFSMKRTDAEVTFEVTKQKDGVESIKPTRYIAKPVGSSMVLVDASDVTDGESIMTVQDWIEAALTATEALGPRTESEIRTWINTNEEHQRLVGKPLTQSSSSSKLSRMVREGVIEKHGTRYSIAGGVA